MEARKSLDRHLPHTCGELERRHVPPRNLQVQVMRYFPHCLSHSIQARASHALLARSQFPTYSSSLPIASSLESIQYPKYYNTLSDDNIHPAGSYDCATHLPSLHPDVRWPFVSAHCASLFSIVRECIQVSQRHVVTTNI